MVANLSAHVQAAHVQTRLEGVPVEMLGNTPLPPLEKGAVRLTLAPYGWYWLHLVDATTRGRAARPSPISGAMHCPTCS